MACCEATLEREAGAADGGSSCYGRLQQLFDIWRRAFGAHFRLHHLRDLRTQAVAAAITAAERQGKCHE